MHRRNHPVAIELFIVRFPILPENMPKLRNMVDVCLFHIVLQEEFITTYHF